MKTNITKIRITKDKITGRGGLALVLRYIENIGLYGLILKTFGNLLQVGHKGLKPKSFLKQMFAFFLDGTNMSISDFDKRKNDEGYSAILEHTPEQMASSHQIKRFFVKLRHINKFIFNKIVHELFVWRLHITQPKIIILGVDTMVMDNDDAKKREGNEVTYKRKKGFQPLHICWNGFLIDVLFRRGSAHSNHGSDYIDRVKAIVSIIRKRYSKEVPIIVCSDSGFADQKAFEYFEKKLQIHYITTSKMYTDIEKYIQSLPDENFGELTKEKVIWKFIEFGNKLQSWQKFRRCIYTRISRDSTGQYIIDTSSSGNLIYTNIGSSPVADKRLMEAGGEEYFKAEAIIRTSHQRGADELIHRSIKEMATKENLPFKKFGMNRAYYMLLVISHFIFEAYKQDVTYDIVPVTAYPNTFRRKLIDFAAKITSGARYVILNVTKTIYNSINIMELWRRCQSPPVIQFA